jgi:hypothetical protein
LQLRVGRTYDEAMKFLDGIPAGTLNRVRNAVPSLGAAGFGALMQAAVVHYARWVDETARAVRGLFVDCELEGFLRSARYWTIVTTDPTARHLTSLIRAELNDLSDSFMDAGNEMRVFKERYKDFDGRCFVLDTNVFLHYQLMNGLPWIKTYGESARVVIPHVVLDEIDRKSYEVNSNMHKRARGIYGMLESLMNLMNSDGITMLKDGTPCLILLDEPGHLRSSSNDEEIVSRAGYLQQYLTPGAVSVLTRDNGMRGRALSWRLNAVKPPDNFQRSEGLSAADVAQALRELE